MVWTVSLCIPMMLFLFLMLSSDVKADGFSKLVKINVSCARAGMNVKAVFDQPFAGLVYAKGYYDYPECHYVPQRQQGATQIKFTIPRERCGMIEEPDKFMETTLIFQNDPFIQEQWDSARRLRCTWYHSLQKAIYFPPFKVYAPQKVPIEWTHQAVNGLVRIERSDGPFQQPTTGFIYAPQQGNSSLALYIQDGGKNMDAEVTDCVMSEGGNTIQMTDHRGCVMHPDMMTQFYRSRNNNELVIYSVFKNFQVPAHSHDMRIRCELLVCQSACGTQCTQPPLLPHTEYVIRSRRRRSVPDASGNARVYARYSIVATAITLVILNRNTS